MVCEIALTRQLGTAVSRFLASAPRPSLDTSALALKQNGSPLPEGRRGPSPLDLFILLSFSLIKGKKCQPKPSLLAQSLFTKDPARLLKPVIGSQIGPVGNLPGGERDA
jgi:hypothetical protein